jgi:hypothetical protein
MLVCLPCSLHSSQQHSVGAGRCPQGELVKGDGLTASRDDALLGSTSETESSNRDLRDLSQPGVVGDGADLDDDFGFTVLGVGGLLYDAREGKGCTVVLGQEESVEDNLIRSSSQVLQT